MKNVIAANSPLGKGTHAFARLEAYVRAQIENSLQVGWAARDILLLANFDYEFMGVEARRISFQNSYPTASKTVAAHELLKVPSLDEELWVHDLDAWQNTWFDPPQFADVGLCEYTHCDRPNFNGGSVWYRSCAKGLVALVVSLLGLGEIREEPALNAVLGARVWKTRVTVLNPTWNVGCCHFVERYLRSDKPIRVCHFHPDERDGVETHLLGRNALGVRTVSTRLEQLLRKHFELPIQSASKAGVAAPANSQTAP